MIGVAVQSTERNAAREFFELCKTPWEFCQADRHYEVVLATTETTFMQKHGLLLVYGNGVSPLVTGQTFFSKQLSAGMVIAYQKKRLPIYGKAATFPNSSTLLATEENTGEGVIQAFKDGERTVVRVGYNLFDEIGHLLSTGQPVEHADKASLELHGRLLRDLVTRAGFPFVEIPPVPDKQNFLVCLTHDIDHPVLRNHAGDHTMFGFLYRATIGSLGHAASGRISLARMFRNWAAAARLPFIYLGMARDFWSEFDRYLQIESMMGATYFFIPERGNPGRRKTGLAPAKRACRYTLDELEPQIQRILKAGNEIGLHGLNAWISAAEGQREKALLEKAGGPVESGVRMHWLYFDADSPAALDEAGFSYDSTFGYNQTVGYRAGTTQVYRTPGLKHMLELPLHVMDTALFYPDYLNLKEDEAYRRVIGLLDDFSNFGGAFTINWHDRSIAPERLWDDFYIKLLVALRQRNAWFATATQAVLWFRQRRSAVVESVSIGRNEVHVRASLTKLDSNLPGLRIRVHRPHIPATVEPLATGPDQGFVDAQFNDNIDLCIAL